jgi:hypothetical protein
MPEEQRYYSFLLRVWRSGRPAAPRWRAALEDTRTGERHGFASLAQAFAFLEQQTQSPAEQAPPHDSGDL